MSGAVFEPVAFDDPRVAPLLRAFDAEMQVRYPGSEPSEASPDDFAAERGLFLLGLLQDAPVACGGLRTHAPGVGELKKLYVGDAARGTGTGRALVRALTDRARARGFTRLVLQTGLEQPEAIGLYESEGWTPIPVYGQYADDPRCRCYALPLS